MRKERLVYGVGINDAGYPIDKRVLVDGKRKILWMCPFYKRWQHMLERCYSTKYHEKFPTYKDCAVCEDWKYFSRFKKWMESQDWKGKHLDKDFLVEGNKLYSSDTCVFILPELNTFITKGNGATSKYPIGVHYMKHPKGDGNEYPNPYRSSISGTFGDKKVKLGCFRTPEKAHKAYLIAKLAYCEGWIERTKEDKVLTGLVRIKDKIKYHIDNNLELTSF